MGALALGEKIDIDGREIWWNGFGIVFSGGMYFIPTPIGPPTEEEARYALRGWDAGYLLGKQTGRAILQNEFRNLMDCQPR